MIIEELLMIVRFLELLWEIWNFCRWIYDKFIILSYDFDDILLDEFI